MGRRENGVGGGVRVLLENYIELDSRNFVLEMSYERLTKPIIDMAYNYRPVC